MVSPAWSPYSHFYNCFCFCTALNVYLKWLYAYTHLAFCTSKKLPNGPFMIWERLNGCTSLHFDRECDDNFFQCGGLWFHTCDNMSSLLGCQRTLGVPIDTSVQLSGYVEAIFSCSSLLFVMNWPIFCLWTGPVSLWMILIFVLYWLIDWWWFDAVSADWRWYTLLMNWRNWAYFCIVWLTEMAPSIFNQWLSMKKPKFWAMFKWSNCQMKCSSNEPWDCKGLGGNAP